VIELEAGGGRQVILGILVQEFLVVFSRFVEVVKGVGVQKAELEHGLGRLLAFRVIVDNPLQVADGFFQVRPRTLLQSGQEVQRCRSGRGIRIVLKNGIQVRQYGGSVLPRKRLLGLCEQVLRRFTPGAATHERHEQDQAENRQCNG